MSAICGIIHFDGAPVDSQALRAMIAAAAHRGPDGVRDWMGANAGLAHLAFHVTPESVRETEPLVSADGRLVLVADARIDNRDELIAALRGEPDLPLDPTDADLILAAFRRWGEACPERLLGDFVFAVWDLAERRLFVVRDALGGRGLCYHFDGRRCLFASEVGQILDSPDWEARINEGKVADYLADFTHGQEETFFQRIFYVAPAQCLTITSQGIRKRRYWDIDPDARVRYRDDREYAHHFREILTAATRCRMRSIGPIGLSLSGGLDSTLLAAIASGLLADVHPTQSRLKTFSYVSDQHKVSDEREYILPVAEHHALDARYIPCDDKWALKNLPRWPVERDYIWSDAYSGPVIEVAESARSAGCRVLFSGQFGDALFLGGYYWLAELLRERRFRELLGLWHAHARDISWRRDGGMLGGQGVGAQMLRFIHFRSAWAQKPCPPYTLHTERPSWSHGGWWVGRVRVPRCCASSIFDSRGQTSRARPTPWAAGPAPAETASPPPRRRPACRRWALAARSCAGMPAPKSRTGLGTAGVSPVGVGVMGGFRAFRSD